MLSEHKSPSAPSPSKKDEFFIDLPSTRRYVAPPITPASQIQPQKGPTCWYSGLLHARGSFVPVDNLSKTVKALGLDKNLEDDPRYAELLRRRNIEKEICRYRNFLAKHEELVYKNIRLCSKLINEKKMSEGEKKAFDDSEKLFQNRISKLIDKLKELKVIKTEENYQLLKSACSDPRNKHHINCHIMFLAGMGYGMIGVLHGGDRVTPSFDDILATLRDAGPLCVYGELGDHCYKSSSQKTDEKLGNRDVFSNDEKNYDASRYPNATHAVVVVGAKRISPGNEFVYFIDPNEPQRVYKIAYDAFASRIKEVIDGDLLRASVSKSETRSAIRSYGYALRGDLFDIQQRHYQHVLNKMLQTMLNTSFWHNKVSTFSSWGQAGSIWQKNAKGENTRVTLPKGVRAIIAELKSCGTIPPLEVINNIKKIAADRLKSPSWLRDTATTQFYQAMTQLEPTQGALTNLLALFSEQEKQLGEIKLNELGRKRAQNR